MNRIQKSETLRNAYFAEMEIFTEDPDLKAMYENYVFGDVYHHGELELGLRELIVLVVLCTNQTFDTFEDHVKAALKAGLQPLQIREAIYQCAPYVGFLKVNSALKIVNVVFKEQGITVPLPSTSTVTEETRYDKGLAIQIDTFGSHMKDSYKNAPDELKHIQEYLSAYCFGDIYTRVGLDMKVRELLTFSMIASLGGCESQLRSHAMGNISVGNTREDLLAAITQCQPYIGFPRTLNAIAIINEVTAEK